MHVPDWTPSTLSPKYFRNVSAVWGADCSDSLLFWHPRNCDIDCHSLGGLSLSHEIRFVQYWVFLASKSMCFLCNASTQACLSSLVFECLYLRSSFRHIRMNDDSRWRCRRETWQMCIWDQNAGWVQSGMNRSWCDPIALCRWLLDSRYLPMVMRDTKFVVYLFVTHLLRNCWTDLAAILRRHGDLCWTLRIACGWVPTGELKMLFS